MTKEYKGFETVEKQEEVKEVPAQLEPVGTGETLPSRLSERYTERVNKISDELSELFKADEYQTTSKD